MSKEYSNGLVRYTSRDYKSILDDFISVVPALTSLWNPESEADPGYVIAKFIASAADMLGVNADWLATEIYAPSVSQRKDAEKVFGLLGYKLGWYTAARTEVTIKNIGSTTVTVPLGFAGNTFSTLNAYTDITGQARNIVYNILPGTGPYGQGQTRGTRKTTTDVVAPFVSDNVTLSPGEYVVRQAIEGELRNYSISVADIKANGYTIQLPSQHVDTTAVWISGGIEDTVQWIQVESPSDFVDPEPRFAVVYDNYSNAQIQISSYIDVLQDYANMSLTVYWIDCSGVIGCVGTDVLTNLLVADPGDSQSADYFDEAALSNLEISNLSNTLELPHTGAVTGKSPETAKEAYENSRKYVNTSDSLITLPDFIRFLTREPGVDCGTVLDCQKALEWNLSIYNDLNLTDSQKSKKYISSTDFKAGDNNINWQAALNLEFDPQDPNKFVFSTNFKKYTAMCFAVHNEFESSVWGQGQISYSTLQNRKIFKIYKPPVKFIEAVKKDYLPLKAMTTKIEFGNIRVFDFHIVGTIYPKRPIDRSTATALEKTVEQALSLHFSPSNKGLYEMPSLVEVIEVVRESDDLINYFDAGSKSTDPIVWDDCDIEYFNCISFARYNPDASDSKGRIQVASEYITGSN